MQIANQQGVRSAQQTDLCFAITYGSAAYGPCPNGVIINGTMSESETNLSIELSLGIPFFL